MSNNQLLQHIEENGILTESMLHLLAGEIAGGIIGAAFGRISKTSRKARSEWALAKEKSDTVLELLQAEPDNKKLKKEYSSAEELEARALKKYKILRTRESGEHAGTGMTVGFLAGAAKNVADSHTAMRTLRMQMQTGAAAAPNAGEADKFLKMFAQVQTIVYGTAGAFIGFAIGNLKARLTAKGIKLRSIWKAKEGEMMFALDEHLANPKDKVVSKLYRDSIKAADASHQIYFAYLQSNSLKWGAAGLGLGAIAGAAHAVKTGKVYYRESVELQESVSFNPRVAKLGASAGAAIGGVAGMISASFNKDVKKKYIAWQNAQAISDEMFFQMAENPLDREAKNEYNKAKKDAKIAKVKYTRLRMKYRAINGAAGAVTGAAIGGGAINPAINAIRKIKMGKVRTYTPPLALN